MELEATVNYSEGTACFKIRKENPGIYHAYLLFFEGNKRLCPPNEIVLTRGIRHWAGSCENEELLNKLGKIIADFLEKAKTNEKSRGLTN